MSYAIDGEYSEEVELAKLTWTEVRLLLKTGKTSIIIPTAGIEQNGPHAILGKHGFIIRYTATAIAKNLGNALVAPPIETVPQGTIEPPTGHMNFPGTISMPEEVFEQILEYSARSFKSHGFKTILFIGESGGNQGGQKRIAEKLNKEWEGTNTRVIHVSDYYSGNGQVEWLQAQGYSKRQIGTHAGIRDTSELLFVFLEGIRKDHLSLEQKYYTELTGRDGDSSLASKELGELMLNLKIEAAIKQIERLTAHEE